MPLSRVCVRRSISIAVASAADIPFRDDDRDARDAREAMRWSTEPREIGRVSGASVSLSSAVVVSLFGVMSLSPDFHPPSTPAFSDVPQILSSTPMVVLDVDVDRVAVAVVEDEAVAVCVGRGCAIASRLKFLRRSGYSMPL